MYESEYFLLESSIYSATFIRKDWFLEDPFCYLFNDQGHITWRPAFLRKHELDMLVPFSIDDHLCLFKNPEIRAQIVKELV
jgi:hypothetical protein